MNIVYFGNNGRGIHLLKYLSKSNRKIVGVVSDPKFDTNTDWYQSIRKTSESLELNTLSPKDVNSDDVIYQLSSLRPDLFVLCGYSKLLSKKLLHIPHFGSINLHAGKVPQYRGAAPLNWAIINDEPVLGISILEVDEGIDTGPIVAQTTFKLEENDTIKTVSMKVQELYCALLDEALNKIEAAQKIVGIEQNKNEGFQYKRRKKEDGQIDWKKHTARQVYNLVRALTDPYPGAFCECSGVNVDILEANFVQSGLKGSPGEIIEINQNKQSVTIMCKDKPIEITKCRIGSDDVYPMDAFKKITKARR